MEKKWKELQKHLAEARELTTGHEAESKVGEGAW